MKEPLWNALLRQLLLPLVSGGDLQLLRPIGTKRAIELSEIAALATPDMLEGLAELRLRRARVLYPLDVLEVPSRAEWLLAAAFNDLLVATHPGLKSWLGRKRVRAVLEMVSSTLDLVGAPKTLAEALARHASFGLSYKLERRDTTIKFWAGSETFIGEKPPARYSLWPNLRKVRISEECVGIRELMPEDEPEQALYREVLRKWLNASPLSELASLGYRHSEFVWTSGTLSLIAVPLGRTLALRALEWNGELRAALAIARAALAKVPESSGEHLAFVSTFADELEERIKRQAIEKSQAV